jgi:hypothetical protein
MKAVKIIFVAILMLSYATSIYLWLINPKDSTTEYRHMNDKQFEFSESVRIVSNDKSEL